MINEIDIRHFRGFKSLTAKFCRPLNVIVGQNGTGKTALLEAIFLALGSSPTLAWRLKQSRGFDGSFHGSNFQILEAFSGDYFNSFDLSQDIQITLKADGTDNRSLTIGRGLTESVLPLDDSSGTLQRSLPIKFIWRDSMNRVHESVPKILGGGLKIDDNEENLPDFYMFSATQPTLSAETANRFSVLSRAKRETEFVSLIAKEFPWVMDLNLEVVAGSPILYATVAGEKEKVPLNSISSGINRIVAIYLAIAVSKGAVVLVDEVENGIYYKHLESVWRTILHLLRSHRGQMFVTSHSGEALHALRIAAGNNVNDINFWRLEKKSGGEVVLRQFSGNDLAAALDSDDEVR